MIPERLVLWLAALAVFAIVNPVTGLDPRAWQEIVLVYGGFAAVVWALSGGGLLGGFSIWCLALAAWHRTPSGMNHVLMLCAFLGLFTLARRTGAAPPIIRWVVALNCAAFALQVAGLWLPLLRLVSPAATVTIYNGAHPHAGLTASTADLACVLASGLPFCATRRWWPVAALGWLILLDTSALSGIVAGIAGGLVIGWPWLRDRFEPGWRFGYGLAALACVASFLGRAEIATAASDDRWSAWQIGARLWVSAGTLPEYFFGRGLGTWQNANVFRTGVTGQPELWGTLHFDALQLAYEAGLVGLALAAGVAARAILRGVRASRWAAVGALVALIVAQVGHFPFHLAAPSVVAALALGEVARA